MPGDFNTLNTCFFNLSLCLQHFLGPFFHSRTIALPPAFPVVWAYGSESEQCAVKVMQVNEIAPKPQRRVRVGEYFVIQKSTLVECGFLPQKWLVHVIKACANGG